MNTIAEGFKAAKQNLNVKPGDGKRHFICFALGEALSKKQISYKTYATCLTIVRERLGNSAFISGWLASNGVPESDITPTKLATYRHAWLDLLIKEFS